MSRKGAESRGETGGLAEACREQHGGRPLRAIEKERERGNALATCAQHVRRADIAGADLAQIAETGESRQNEPEGYRSEEIAPGKGEDVDEEATPSGQRDGQRPRNTA